MTITVRSIRHGLAVRLTGAHARVFNGLLADLVGSAKRTDAAPSDLGAAQPLNLAPTATKPAHPADWEGRQ